MKFLKHPVASRTVLPLAVCALVVTASAAGKTHPWFRFTPMRQRDNPPTTLIQLSEFRFLHQGDRLDLAGVSVTNPGGSSPAGEDPAKAIDGSTDSKWLDLTMHPLVFHFPQAVTIDAYGFTTANDAAERDPGNWRFEGSDDGSHWVLLDERINPSVPTARFTETEDFALPATVPPYASFWYPESLLRWTPEADTATEFNRSFVPRAARTSNLAFQANSHARANEGGATILSAFAPTSYSPSQGSRVRHYNAYTGWQYTDKMVFWGGSAGEGLILAPNAPVIDAGHRNGVPVLGTIFFPPTAYGGQFGFVRAMLQKDGESFPVADKLIEMTRHYGFDGWFINQETAGGNSGDAADMRDFISYFRAQAPELEIMWYDAMTENGSISWQNALTSSNDMFLSHNGSRVADSMFLNFWWSTNGLANSRSLAQSLGVDPYEVYAGVDFESGGYDASIDWSAIFPENQPHRLSLAFYGQQAVFNHSSDPVQFYDREILFFSGQNGDPSNTATSSNWKGMAHYFPATTPLQSLPFVTHFNRGQGQSYFVNGVQAGDFDWNNLSTQDVLPTWRWIVHSTGSQLHPTLQLGEAYTGGTSLLVEGTLDATNDIPLYAANLPVTSRTRARIIFKTGQSGAPSRMKLAIAFQDAPGTLELWDAGSTTSSGWTTTTFNLAAHAGRTIGSIGLRFASTSTVSNYSIRIGQLALYNGAISTPSPVTDLRVTQTDALTADQFAVRLAWDPSPTSGLYYYNVFRRFPNGDRRWLGTTSARASYVPDLTRVAGETTAQLEVEAVGGDFGTSVPATIAVPMPEPAGFEHSLTGESIGTAGSWNDLGDTRDKAFDGNPATFFDAPVSDGCWTGLDFSSQRASRITGISFLPRAGWAFRMPGGVFQAANEPDFSDAVTLHTITDTPPEGIYTRIAIDQPGLYRYFRYADDPHCNVAEIEVYGWQVPGPPQDLAARRFSDHVELTWSAPAWAESYRVEGSDTPSGPFVELASGLTTPALTEAADLSADRYYRVTTLNPAGESTAATVASPAPEAFDAWTILAFDGSIDPALVAGSADPDHDGLANLLEFVLQLDPLAPSTPDWTLQTDAAGVSLTFRRPGDISGVQLAVEWSSDLAHWSTDGIQLQETVIDPATTEVRARLDDPGLDCCYLRISALEN
ncbi:endo-beta-N-acetylglucosaminidase [Haloferula sargassicola]